MKYFETPIPDQKFLAFEVVQTSAMDCGPATLKSVLEGFDIPVSYGRLREACQTDVDGTSIDTIEDIAIQLGLFAEQIMIPVDHLILPESQALPAILVVRRPNGLTHFLVVWGKFGPFLQIMDPATGRRWPRWHEFQTEIYTHTFPVSAKSWSEWARSEGMLAPLRHRMKIIQVPSQDIEWLIHDAISDSGWMRLASLDAAVRMVTAIVKSKGISAGDYSSVILKKYYQANLSKESADPMSSHPGNGAPFLSGALYIPQIYWSVSPITETNTFPTGKRGIEMLNFQGAVLVRILGKRNGRRFEDVKEQILSPDEIAVLPRDLKAAITELPSDPEQAVYKALKEDGLFLPGIVSLAVLISAITVTLQALLFQGILQIGQSLSLLSQRVWGVMILLVFLVIPLLLDIPINSSILRMGRRLEIRLRIALLEKIPRLGDRYFRSRLASDMTQRAHDLRQLRQLPNLGFNILRIGSQLLLTMIGVIFLDPISAPLAIIGTGLFMALSYFSRPLVEERDLRLRTQTGALSRFYLDALLGLMPIKSHGAEKAYRRQHEFQLYDWVKSGREYFRTSIFLQSFGTLLYTSFAVLIIMNYIAKGGDTNEILLVFYWTLSLPTLGQSLVSLLQLYPIHRNRINRILEPLSAPNEEETLQLGDNQAKNNLGETSATHEPVEITMSNVWIQAGGHEILKDINLYIKPGEHISIVGPSGAGKSSLIGLLLGWHRPSKGKILVNGILLDGLAIQVLRRATAWVDPTVQLWNRSLFENLRYGQANSTASSIIKSLETADLFEVMERLPDGMKTNLGESGGLVSGGEGQRIRFGRAFLKKGVTLVLLDEPFRGLDRQKRSHLLSQARTHWAGITLIFISHDVLETLSFPRVIVMNEGRIIEDGSPNILKSKPDSYYNALLDAAEDVQSSFWKGIEWRRFTMVDGKIEEQENR